MKNRSAFRGALTTSVIFAVLLGPHFVLLADDNHKAALAKKVAALVDRDEQRLLEIFKHLHANPELGFQEVKTAALVAKEFKALGYETHTGIGKTGVVGILKNGPGPVVMFRSDMDALPVLEETGLPYASRADRPGRQRQPRPGDARLRPRCPRRLPRSPSPRSWPS